MPTHLTSWGVLLPKALADNGEIMSDIIESTLTPEQLAAKFDPSYGSAEGCPFTVWTVRRVYFPAVYDGSEWIASVSRIPDGVPTDHIGGQ